MYDLAAATPCPQLVPVCGFITELSSSPAVRKYTKLYVWNIIVTNVLTTGLTGKSCSNQTRLRNQAVPLAGRIWWLTRKARRFLRTDQLRRYTVINAIMYVFCASNASPNFTMAAG